MGNIDGRHLAALAIVVVPGLPMSTTRSDLVDTAIAHIKIVVAVTDRLTELGNSEAELRSISLRLQEAAFRALTSPGGE